MKRTVLTTMLCLVAATCLTAAEPLRVWESRKGTLIKARFLRRVGGLVVLEKTDGTQVQVSARDLHSRDREYLERMATAEKETELKRRREALSGMRRAAPERTNGERPDYLSKLEWQVVCELNDARGDPAAYAKNLKNYRRRHQGNGVFMTERGPMRSQEGVAVVDEAIAFLEQAKPLPPLAARRGLSLAAKDHARDTGPKGIVSHTGTDDSTFDIRVRRRGRSSGEVGENISYGCLSAESIVMQLIIDDGVKDRGHRKNIFSKSYGVVGVAAASHAQYGMMCVIDFAGGFADQGSSR